MFHSSTGHTTYFNDSVTASIRAKMKDCECQGRVDTVMVDFKQLKTELMTTVEESTKYQDSYSSKKQLTQVCAEITCYNNAVVKIEYDASSTSAKLAIVDKLKEKVI